MRTRLFDVGELRQMRSVTGRGCGMAWVCRPVVVKYMRTTLSCCAWCVRYLLLQCRAKGITYQ